MLDRELRGLFEPPYDMLLGYARVAAIGKDIWISKSSVMTESRGITEPIDIGVVGEVIVIIAAVKNRKQWESGSGLHRIHTRDNLRCLEQKRARERQSECVIG